MVRRCLFVSKDPDTKDFQAVEKNREEIIPEGTPDGAYGSPYAPSEASTNGLKPDRRAISAFTYENRELHEGNKRKDPGAHPTHDSQENDD
ncbi:hypothetical protein HXA35_16685 [Bacillus sp. A301a_S52]|nr:hypothetical protein [Bacillus sp. A301a_S52]